MAKFLAVLEIHFIRAASMSLFRNQIIYHTSVCFERHARWLKTQNYDSNPADFVLKDKRIHDVLRLRSDRGQVLPSFSHICHKRRVRCLSTVFFSANGLCRTTSVSVLYKDHWLHSTIAVYKHNRARRRGADAVLVRWLMDYSFSRLFVPGNE